MYREVATSPIKIPSTKLHPFEFQIFRDLKTWNLEGTRVLVACSGGRDSMVLAHCLSRIAKRLRFEIGVAVVHHGPSSDANLSVYRDKGVRWVESWARENQVAFHRLEEAPTAELVSEESLRDHRHKLLRKILQLEGYGALAFAHHADDLLETRLMRLIRGTGAHGLRAMRAQSKITEGRVLRPLLKCSTSDLESYAKDQGLRWIDDPSNQDVHSFRNWMRNEWLPKLEQKRPGSVKAMARSFETLLEEVAGSSSDEGTIPPVKSSEKVPTYSRKQFAKLGNAEQRKGLVEILRALGIHDFRSNQVEEVRKRLHTSRKNLRFELLGLVWEVNAEQITAKR